MRKPAKPNRAHICRLSLAIIGCLLRWWLWLLHYNERGKDPEPLQPHLPKEGTKTYFVVVYAIWSHFHPISRLWLPNKDNSLDMVLNALIYSFWGEILLPGLQQKCTGSPTLKTNLKFCNFWDSCASANKGISISRRVRKIQTMCQWRSDETTKVLI